MNNILASLYALLDSDEWKTTVALPTYPSDYKGQISGIPYLRVNLIPGKGTRKNYDGTKEINGVIIVQIFTKSGKGQLEPSLIANKLDTVLEGQKLNDKTSLDYSTTIPVGPDPDDRTLYIHEYSVPFQYFGG